MMNHSWSSYVRAFLEGEMSLWVKCFNATSVRIHSLICSSPVVNAKRERALADPGFAFENNKKAVAVSLILANHNIVACRKGEGAPVLINNNARTEFKREATVVMKDKHRSRRVKYAMFVMAMYVGFVGVCAFAPHIFSVQLSPSIPLSLLVGPGMITVLMVVAAWDMFASKK